MLDFGPMHRVFAAIYGLGLRVVLSRMTRHPAVHSVYGWGSYFEGTYLAGQSDIDLGIVISEDYSRDEGTYSDVARCYNRWRWLFPFLGRWDEKEGSLIFLEEVVAGFPVLASFRVKVKQGRVEHLYGEPFPVDFGDDGATESEIIEEIDTLVRLALLKGEQHSRRLLFWKRLFTKLFVLSTDLRLSGLLDEAKRQSELAFLGESDRKLYGRTGQAEDMFRRFVALVKQILQAVKDREAAIRISYRPYPANHAVVESESACPDALLSGSGIRIRSFRELPSGPMGLVPHLYYFPIDKPVPFVELEDGAYRDVRRLILAMGQGKAKGGAYLLRVEGLLFVVTDEGTYVDVVPLDPLLFANVYARLEGKLSFEMPRCICEQQRHDAEQTFAGLESNYGKHDGRLTKYSYPCIFTEDDVDTLCDTFEFFRSYVAHADDWVY
ncbi:nucleotidyltransferase domain-containing protein, partial [bacterium]|nr:nucleotidyltransferase domain-containing protein [bacterium]